MERPNRKEVETEVTKLWDAGGDFESLLSYMRENGVSQSDSFLMLEKVTGVDRASAQRITFQSRTWADRQEVNAQLQKDLIQAIKELSEEDPNFKVSFEFEGDPEESGEDPEER
jgi:DNA repair ATPase RecN